METLVKWFSPVAVTPSDIHDFPFASLRAPGMHGPCVKKRDRHSPEQQQVQEEQGTAAHLAAQLKAQLLAHLQCLEASRRPLRAPASDRSIAYSIKQNI